MSEMLQKDMDAMSNLAICQVYVYTEKKDNNNNWINSAVEYIKYANNCYSMADILCVHESWLTDIGAFFNKTFTVTFSHFEFWIYRIFLKG